MVSETKIKFENQRLGLSQAPRLSGWSHCSLHGDSGLAQSSYWGKQKPMGTLHLPTAGPIVMWQRPGT